MNLKVFGMPSSRAGYEDCVRFSSALAMICIPTLLLCYADFGLKNGIPDVSFFF